MAASDSNLVAYEEIIAGELFVIKGILYKDRYFNICNNEYKYFHINDTCLQLLILMKTILTVDVNRHNPFTNITFMRCVYIYIYIYGFKYANSQEQLEFKQLLLTMNVQCIKFCNNKILCYQKHIYVCGMIVQTFQNIFFKKINLLVFTLGIDRILCALQAELNVVQINGCFENLKQTSSLIFIIPKKFNLIYQ